VLVQYGVYVSLNTGGCIVVAEPCNMPCAEAITADFECEVAACDLLSGPCQITNNATLAVWDVCKTATDTAPCGCSGFNQVTACTFSLQDATKHPAASLCGLMEMDFAKRFTILAALMCGHPPTK
jgi:hypothetical protein